MKSLKEMLKERALRASPADQAWAATQHAEVRAYFAGDRSSQALRQTLRGYHSFRLTSLTVPGTEEWSLLMAALDLLLDGEGEPGRVPDMRMKQGWWMSYDEYVGTCFPPRVEKKVGHLW
jgi:hypothetical protein